MKKYRSLAEDFPDIAKQWHPTKNGNTTPDMVAARINRKAWWIGPCGHEWEAAISSRTKGVGCPFCRNLYALEGYNDLTTTHPDLVKEWNYERNGNLKPSEVTYGSHKKVWWKCSKGHEWEDTVRDRTTGKECPYCTNQKVLSGYNDLATVKPEVASEWNYEKNGKLTPDQVKYTANKKVWWICSKGHEWNAYVFNRSKGVGCPICTNRSVLEGFNDLASTHPKLVKEWNYEKNGRILPTSVTAGSNKSVWWKCEKGHEWKSNIKSRVNGNNCPYCSNQTVLEGYNDFATVYPELTKEWSKKNKVSPSEIIRGGDEKFYWICPIGHDDYPMSVRQRVMGQGCPKCAQQSQTSFPEQALFYYIKQEFPDAINRYTMERNELDIFIPSKRLGIEYDGYFSHKGKADKDAKKQAYFAANGIALIRVKEYKYEYEKEGADFYIHERTTFQSITELTNQLIKRLVGENRVSVDCERDQIAIKEQYIDSKQENSIALARPEILSEGDYERNGSIKPEFVSRNSRHKYFWICSKCGYSYSAAPVSRNKGTGCPACAGKVVHQGHNDLLTKCPDIMKEWDCEKNEGLNPETIFYRSHTEVWWKCEKGHSWLKSIYSRTYNNSKCPYCTGRNVITGFNDLQTKCPDIAEEWDYELNSGTPDMIHFNNQTIEVHWICKNCGYKWTHTVSQRDRCPECLRRKTQIIVYNAYDRSLYGKFDNARSLCEHLGIDYNKNQNSISNVCRRVRKLFLGKYILRHPCDDEIGLEHS